MSNLTSITPFEVLLVEDNPGDIRLMQEALKQNKLLINLNVVGNGDDALAYLQREDKFVNASRPELVLLDLNLPKIDGREVLDMIKNDDNLKRIPVVVLTISEDEEDILKSYDLHANCFITKPVDMDQFLKVVKSIKEFWLTIVKLPPNGVKED